MSFCLRKLCHAGIVIFVCSAIHGHALARTTVNCQLALPAHIPQSVIAINQTSIENMLRLDLEHKLVATAFLDDAIPADLAKKLEDVPNIASHWPNREQVLALRPELIYAGFPTAFSPSTLGQPQWWQHRDMSVLINQYSCQPSSQPLVWSDAWQDLHLLADIFDKQSLANQLEAQALAALPKQTNKPKPKVLLLDVYSQNAQVGGCCGGADLMIRLAGGEHIGATIAGRWSQLSWETVAQFNPDIIVLATYQRFAATAVENKLNNHPLLSKMQAVKHGRIVQIPFTATLASPRIVEGVAILHKVVQSWY